MTQEQLARHREAVKKWRVANPEKNREYSRASSKKFRLANPSYSKEWYAAHPEKGRAHARNNYARHRAARIETMKKWRTEHPEQKRAIDKNWRLTHAEQKRETDKRLYDAHRVQRIEYSVKWNAKHPESRKRIQRKWEHAHPETIAMRNMVKRMLRAFGGLKSARFYQYIGCTPAFLRLHLEAQFKKGMTWANYSEVWEVDHRVPLAWFNLKHCPENMFIASHWTNLQPMFKETNRSKGSRRVA